MTKLYHERYLLLCVQHARVSQVNYGDDYYYDRRQERNKTGFARR